MKYRLLLEVFITTVLLTSTALPQSFAPQAQGHERLQRFKKMRLVEVLKLNEDESVRFFAKQNAHEDKIRELMKSRNEMLDALDRKASDKADAKDIQKLSSDVLNVDEQVFAERKRFQDELRNFLTPEQFGKYLVFERNFEHHMREAMEDMMQNRRRRDRDD